MTALAKYAMDSIVKMNACTAPMKILKASQITDGTGIQIGMSFSRMMIRISPARMLPKRRKDNVIGFAISSMALMMTKIGVGLKKWPI